MQCLTLVQELRVASGFQKSSEGQHHISRMAALSLALPERVDVFETAYFWLMTIYVFRQSKRRRDFPQGCMVVNMQCRIHENREIVNGHDNR